MQLKLGFRLALILGIILIFIAGNALAENLPNDAAAAPQPPPETSAGSETRLLPSNIDVWSGDWAPDGKAMVFAGKPQGEDAVQMRIWYWALDPIAEPVQLTHTEGLVDFSPRWSPDGKKIALIRRNLGKPENATGNSAVWLKEIPGGAGRQLTGGPRDRDPAWSPDGGRIVFSRGQGPYQAQLFIINVGGGAVKLLAGEDGELLLSPWWGSDGKVYFTKLFPYQKPVTLAGQTYQVTEFGNGSIWAINPDNNTLEPVVVDEYDNRQPTLSPDGTKLAFVSNKSGAKDGNGKFDRGSLYIKNIKTGAISFITNKVGLNGGALAWSPDGKKLAFFTFRSIRPAVWVINIP